MLFADMAGVKRSDIEDVALKIARREVLAALKVILNARTGPDALKSVNPREMWVYQIVAERLQKRQHPHRIANQKN